jgi:hypothetical protein
VPDSRSGRPIDPEVHHPVPLKKRKLADRNGATTTHGTVPWCLALTIRITCKLWAEIIFVLVGMKSLHFRSFSHQFAAKSKTSGTNSSCREREITRKIDSEDTMKASDSETVVNLSQ